MNVGGLQKLSLLDYPEHLAAIIFTQGCNFHCHYCYNPQLVVPAPHRPDEVGAGAGPAPPRPSPAFREKRGSREAGAGPAPLQSSTEGPDPNSSKGSEDEAQKGHLNLSEDGLFEFLKLRQGILEAVVITGGEPTIHKDLPEFIAKIKKLGYLVKLDTNGANPEMLQKLIDDKSIDYIAMDIKAPLDKYEKVVGTKVFLPVLEKSVKIIKESNLPYEFRTTLVPDLLDEKDIEEIGELIKSAEKWYLQKFKSDTKLVDSGLESKQPYSEKVMEEMCEVAKRYIKYCEIR